MHGFRDHVAPTSRIRRMCLRTPIRRHEPRNLGPIRDERARRSISAIFPVYQ